MSKRHSNPNLEMTNFEGILTASPKMLKLFELIKRVARTDASVLVRGQTGTGKELVARAIHRQGKRAARPFLAINCATLSPEMLASELFGHVKGAYTGAIQSREGLFKRADGGTLFLDELAEMPLDIQAKLLRVLQEQTFVPIGGTKAERVNVRVISATLRSLRDAVAQQTFRADLMYRVRVVPLFLPRLTERGKDVEGLAWHFIEQFNEQMTLRQVRYLTDSARDALIHYPWPGNIRELRNVIEHAFILGQGDLITLDDLTPELRGEEPDLIDHEIKTAEDIEREMLLDALRQAHGRRDKAAEILNISRSTLWRKLKTHHIVD